MIENIEKIEAADEVCAGLVAKLINIVSGLRHFARSREGSCLMSLALLE